MEEKEELSEKSEQPDIQLFSRRALLRSAGLGALSYLANMAPAIGSPILKPPKNPPVQRLGREGIQSPVAGPSIGIDLECFPTTVPILPGQETQVQTYDARVVTGDPTRVQDMPGSYLGPIIKLNKGEFTTIRFKNRLPYEHTIVHWHGMYVPEKADGHPRYSIFPDETFIYRFRVINRAGTYWFHPHPDMTTGTQVLSGMAGLMLVSDHEEQNLPLPRGDYDVPFIIQDRKFLFENQIDYGGIPFIGYYGDRILVNGKVNYEHACASRSYRLRFVNGSNARTYKLGWEDGSPMILIGTDGGLIERPIEKPYVVIAPGERIEIWKDFSDYPVGTELKLKNLEYSGWLLGFDEQSELTAGSEYEIMTFRVDRKSNENQDLPEQLTKMNWLRWEDAVNRDNPRSIPITWQGMWLLNEEFFEMDGVKQNEIVRPNTTEVWEFTNHTGDLAIAHPIHLHGPQFQVVERTIQEPYRKGWETIRHGYTDEGWKDTVLLMPGESIKFLIRFNSYTGLFLYHCHILEHEDEGMMRNYLVRS